MKYAGRYVERVDGARKRREDEHGVEELGEGRQTSLDGGNDKDGACADGRAGAVDKGMVGRYDEGSGGNGEGVEGEDANVDLTGGHLHALRVGEGAALGGSGGDNVHTNVGEHDVDKCSPGE